MQCPQCQHHNNTTAKFCEECGARLATLAAVPEVPSGFYRLPEAERRQLTVMFCDLIDSTTLSSRLDPEDLRDVIRAYQTTCAEIIQRFGGYIAQYLGDGVLVYFGYPQAHDDTVQRAVRAGLGIVEAVGVLATRLAQERGIRLALRVGIHTGLVVIGAMGSGERSESLAWGEALNIAARIQGLAAPNTVLISETTWRLVEGYFAYKALGEKVLKGIEQPLPLYQILYDRGMQNRVDLPSTRGLTPLVGREREIGLLLEGWACARQGHGRVVILNGEAGLGKSRLVRALEQHVDEMSQTRIEFRGAPYYQHTAFYPLSEFLARMLHFQRQESPEAKLDRLEEALRRYRIPLVETVPLYAELLSLPLPEARYRPLPLTSQRFKHKVMDTTMTLIRELAEDEPLLFVVEDLHWVDPSTLEFVQLLMHQTPTMPLLVLLTHRPSLQQTWPSQPHVTSLTLTPLAQQHVTQIALSVTQGKTLPAEVLAQVVSKTDGVPLFVEELTKMVLESDWLVDQGDHYTLRGPLPPLAIPATLHDSLMARLDRLATVKSVAQLGATIGRHFTYELLQALALLDDATLQDGLRQLVEAELVYAHGDPPAATYLFKHTLIQETAYQSLLRSTRQEYHQRIAQVLESQFPETTVTTPELVAHHYTEGGRHAQAIPYWQQAGRKAYEHSAHVEAISYLTKGLQLLTGLPDASAHGQQEMLLQSTLGSVLMTAYGYASPDVERAYARAYTLCQQVGDARQRFAVMIGLWNFYFARAEFQTARTLGQEIVSLAQTAGDPGMLARVHAILGEMWFHIGDFVTARSYLDQGLASAAPGRRQARSVQAPQVTCGCYVAFALWMAGYPDQAVQRAQNTFTLAQELSHPFGIAMARCGMAWLHQYRQEADIVRFHAEGVMTLATEQGFPFWLSFGMILRGWALTRQGQHVEGLANIRQGLATYRATGAGIQLPGWLALLADSCAWVGQPRDGLAAVDEALALLASTGERCYEAELYRLRGELLCQVAQHSTAGQSEAAAHFQHAILLARQQQSRAWELRAALSLGRLWQHQGQYEAARQLLAPLCEWFVEGSATGEVQAARAMVYGTGL
jgi:class 3 adenylate cyclase/predicted ATPase